MARSSLILIRLLVGAVSIENPTIEAEVMADAAEQMRTHTPPTVERDQLGEGTMKRIKINTPMTETTANTQMIATS
jgi:hypothetical protein